MAKRIVVTGSGSITAIGRNGKEFEQNLFGGRGGIAKHTNILPGQATIAGLIADFSPCESLPNNPETPVDRTAQLAIVAAQEAVTQAQFQGERLGLIVGTSHGGRSQLDRFVENGGNPDEKENGYRFLNAGSHHYQTATIAAHLGIHGPVATVSTACSSGGVAIAYAYELLQANKVDAIIAGGADAFSKLTQAGFTALGATADKPCGPFSDTIGLNLGEGAGFVVLERLDCALAREAPILGELFSYGISWDAYHLTTPEPSGDGMLRALTSALSRAGAKTSQIDYINLHGTGTRANDAAETLALKRLYRDAKVPPASATKSFTGHTLGASASIGFLASLAASRANRLPPTINFGKPRPGCGLDYIPNTARTSATNRFLANSAAFGGVNCVLLGGSFTKTETNGSSQRNDSIVITGIGILSSLGAGLPTFLDGLRKGLSGIRQIDRFNVSHLGATHAGLVPKFDSRQLVPDINVRRFDTVTQYATIAASFALENAGLPPGKRRPDRTGLVVGTTRGAIASYESYLGSVQNASWDQASPSFFPNLVMSSIGGNISTALDLKGLASTLVGGFSVGLHALINSSEFLRRNDDCDAIVVVVADAITPLLFHLSDVSGRLAPGATLPTLYQDKGQGFVLAEGAVALVLERGSIAKARGAQSFASIAGYGLSNDSEPDLTFEDSGYWAEKACREAIDDAQVAPVDLDLVYGLGTGAAAFDSREAITLDRLLSGHSPALCCVTGNTGLAEACCGLFSVTGALLGMQHNEAYPLVSHGIPDNSLSWVRKQPRRGDYRHTLISNSCEHGNNAAIVLRRSATMNARQ